MKQSLILRVQVKEWVGGHFTKIDEFKGTPEAVVDIVLKKFVGKNGFDRLGQLLIHEMKRE